MPNPTKKGDKKIILIDANSFIHRAFYALPPLTNKLGQPIGALFGLVNTLVKAIQTERPDYIFAAFDTPAETFRKKEYKEYKAHRPPTPPELVVQLKKAPEVFSSFGIPVFDKAGYEADDIIGTLSKKLIRTGRKVIILTGDLDALQLVKGNQIKVMVPKRGLSDIKLYDEEAVKERFGLPPKLLPDFKGLVGDKSDNIPGVPGIGPKTAVKILAGKPLEQAIKSSTNPKLAEFKEQALLSKRLATIDRSVPIKFNFKSYRPLPALNSPKLISYLKKMGFYSIANRITANSQPKKQNKKVSAPTVITEDELTQTRNLFSNLTLPPALNSRKTKVALSWKPIIKEALRQHAQVRDPIFDIKIAAWLINPDIKNISLEYLTKFYLNHPPGNKKKDLADLYSILSGQLNQFELGFVFNKIELPLIKVLAKMELKGIKIDRQQAQRLSKEVQKEIELLAREIFQKTGLKPNLNSPRQVGELLFEHLHLKPPAKNCKTKTGQYKTDETTLRQIENQHPAVSLILKHRELSKILTTYLLPLSKVESDRVHTTFLQTATATGRLASESPNLQNIPNDAVWGPAIRNMFVAEEGFSLTAFDYSQIELRILASVSEDKNMISAFRQNTDIHKLTAARIFGLDIDKVDQEKRQIAKTLNFGIIYGMGAKSFSQTSGLSLEEAKKFIQKYFHDFPKVKEWQNKVIQQVQSEQMVRNLNGRLRFIKALGAMDRAAINMPIQSLGADIIKLAMIEVDKLISAKKGWENKIFLLLSIHDELILEIKNDIIDEAIPILKEIMENIYPLKVPLEVKVKKGASWGEIK